MSYLVITGGTLMPKFDITKHKWYNPNVHVAVETCEDILTGFNESGEIQFVHNKDDAIVIASRFNLINNCSCKKRHYD